MWANDKIENLGLHAYVTFGTIYECSRRRQPVAAGAQRFATHLDLNPTRDTP